ncbi:vWA domain-containing protein [Paraliomyxa miuraensis]|uniref:vWA domain-containing protein n=1 Tax=Paraliomyxa miuraensis TaxID=376150 RepID=UPI00225084E9|nr:vWA domain-containing protein [Paraliomyxa miuraensis]MCX4246034.1 VWA domain-containing protein [Paraliomyxa miuraensis]
MTALTVAGCLGACGSKDGERDDTSTTASSLGPLTTTSDDTTTTAPPDSTGPAPSDTTAVDPSATTTADDADTGPTVYFDLGIIPDIPMTECQQSLDIVFVMDVSTTMGGFINLLANEMLAVDAAIQMLDLPDEPHYGLAVFVDDAALLNGGAPYANATALRDDFLMWAAFTASNQQVGGGNSNSTWTENSLDGLYLAANGFQWRPAETTTRIVIHTTDDTFWDGPTIGNGVMIQHGYAETVQALQDQFVRVYAFADQIGGACNCMDVTPGWSTPFMGMLPIPEATDGGVYDINMVLSGAVSLVDAINAAVEESYCDPYMPQG